MTATLIANTPVDVDAEGFLPLLRESTLNHFGKLAFQWVYWHALLPGRPLPGIRPQMPTAGKRPFLSASKGG